jgi:MoaA/NifB/PqqE/SkfB family radical SAM enzyme
MKKVDIKLSFQCNNLCRFCIQGDKRKKFNDKSAEEVKDILEKERNSCEGVVFTGGEPTLQKNLVNYVKYAKKLDYKIIQIQSNARMLAHEKYCLELINAGANFFNPAIHGSTAEIHDYLTRAPGSFNQTLQAIKNLRKFNQNITTQTVITKINYKDLPNIAKMMVDLKPNTFQFAFIHINDIIQANPELIEEIVPRYFLIEPYLKQGLKIGIDSGLMVRTEAIPYCFMKGYEKYVGECEIPNTNIYDGKVITKDFNEIRKSEGKAKGSNCKKCKYYGICEGPWKDYPEIFGWDEFKPIKNGE